VNSATLTDEQLQSLDARIQSIPIVETLGMKINKLEKGHCEATVPRHKRWDGIYETFHGGMLGTIADTVTCWSILPKSERMHTLLRLISIYDFCDLVIRTSFAKPMLFELGEQCVSLVLTFTIRTEN